MAERKWMNEFKIVCITEAVPNQRRDINLSVVVFFYCKKKNAVVAGELVQSVSSERRMYFLFKCFINHFFRFFSGGVLISQCKFS